MHPLIELSYLILCLPLQCENLVFEGTSWSFQNNTIFFFIHSLVRTAAPTDTICLALRIMDENVEITLEKYLELDIDC